VQISVWASALLPGQCNLLLFYRDQQDEIQTQKKDYRLNPQKQYHAGKNLQKDVMYFLIQNRAFQKNVVHK
jgi:hypothetical protein